MDKEQTAIERLKAAPETVRFVREDFRRLELKGVKCILNYPVYKGKRTSMWKLIPQRLIPPMRIARCCCNILKERGGGNFTEGGIKEWNRIRARACRVERLKLTVDDLTEDWTKLDKPVLVITIGEKEVEP